MWNTNIQDHGRHNNGSNRIQKLYATNDTTLINWFKYGALRENENRVYFYLFANETEVLLYDFNLDVGENLISTHNSIEYQGCPIECIYLR